MKINQSGFTFVELIVVLVIIAILATIGFVTYESYLSVGRDTVKISLLKDINTSFGTYGLKSRLPLPDNKIDITASGSIFAYQGDFTQKTADTIGFKGDPHDDDLDIYPTYMLSLNKKETQLLHYLEDPQSIQSFFSQTYAYTDYQQLYPKLVGKSLGVMVDSQTQEPLHLVDVVSASGSYDVVNGTGNVKAYYSQNESFETNISRIIPDKNCKRILDLGASKGSGIYTVNPTGTKKIRVYCDMETQGGGWNIVVNNDNRDDEYISTSANTCYPRLSGFPAYACGAISASEDFVINAQGMEFNELVWGVYEGNFHNIKTYRYLLWDSIQTIPDTSTFQIPRADSDREILQGYQDLNLMYCSSNPTVPVAFIATQAPNNGFPHNPVTTVGRNNHNNGKLSFTNAGATSGTSSSYGFDSFKDGQSCSTTYSDRAYIGYSSYIMIR